MAFIKVIPSRFSRSIYYVLEIFLLSCFLCLLTMLEELACKVLSITFLGVFIVSLAFFELCLYSTIESFEPVSLVFSCLRICLASIDFCRNLWPHSAQEKGLTFVAMRHQMI